MFLGTVVTKSQTVDQYLGHPAAFIANMVFTPSNSSSPWLLAIWSGYTGAYDYGNPEIPQWDPADPQVPGSHSFSLPAPVRPGLDASRLAAMLAAEWQSWADRGAAITMSPFSSAIGQSMPPSIDRLKQRGITERIRFRPNPSVGVYEFGLFDKNDLACTAIDYERTLTPSKTGELFYQSEDQSERGPALEPGAYQSMTFIGVAEVCLYIQSGTSPIKVNTPGFMDTAATGKLVTPPPTPAASSAPQSI